MSDVNGAAPAAADSPSMPADTGAPISDSPASFSQPLGSQIPPEAQAKNEPKAPPSIDDSIDRAMAKADAKVKEPAKVDAKAPVVKEPAKTEQPRENGKFAPKEPAKADTQVKPNDTNPTEPAKPSHTAGDPPARFTDTAKQKWAVADPEIRGEVSRMERELTQGFEKHRKAAERDASLQEFHEMAEKSGTDVKTALSKYVAMETLLRQDTVKGLEEICRNAGISLRDVAAHVMGQTPEQNASTQDATIRELRTELAGLKQQVGTVTQTFEKQRNEQTTAEVTKFAAEHPRFDELHEDIAFFLKNRTKDLSEAYTLAERLNPVQGQATTTAASSAPAIPDLSAHTDKGQKSINGAPATGLTSPAKKRAALSLDDALDRAFGAV